MHISPDDKRLQYCGRIDFDDPKAPVLVYAASLYRFVLPEQKFRDTGKQACLLVEPDGIYIRRKAGTVLTHLRFRCKNVCDCRRS